MSSDTMFAKCVDSFASHKFIGHSILPLPSYLYYLILSQVGDKYDLMLRRILLGVMKMIMILIINTVHKRKTKRQSVYFPILLFIFIFSRYFEEKFISNRLFAGLFFWISQLFSINSFRYTFFLSLSLMCDLSIMPFHCLFHILQFFQILRSKGYKKSSIWPFLRMLTLISLNFFLFNLIIFQDLKIRNVYTEEEAVKPYIFEIRNELIGNLTGSTSEYIMDQSVIKIVNRKHSRHLENEEDYYEIIKVHPDKNVSVNDRFLKSGDTIRLFNLSTKKYLGKSTSVESNERFLPVIFEENPKDFTNFDFTIGISLLNNNNTDILLKAKQPFEIYSKDQNVFCMTDSYPFLYFSVYSEISSRLFYIVENFIHHEYSTMLKDEHRLEAKIKNYHFNVFSNRLTTFLCYSSQILNNIREDYPPFLLSAKNLILIGFSATIILFIAINHILYERFKRKHLLSMGSFYVNNFVMENAMLVIFGFIGILCYGFNCYTFVTIQFLFIFSFVENFLAISVK